MFDGAADGVHALASNHRIGGSRVPGRGGDAARHPSANAGPVGRRCGAAPPEHPLAGPYAGGEATPGPRRPEPRGLDVEDRCPLRCPSHSAAPRTAVTVPRPRVIQRDRSPRRSPNASRAVFGESAFVREPCVHAFPLAVFGASASRPIGYGEAGSLAARGGDRSVPNPPWAEVRGGVPRSASQFTQVADDIFGLPQGRFPSETAIEPGVAVRKDGAGTLPNGQAFQRPGLR